MPTPKVCVKILSFILLFSYSLLNAQSLQIRAVDSNKKPIFGASVVLKLETDTTKIWGGLTDTSGIIKLNIPTANYWLTVTSIGYKNYRKGIRIVSKPALVECILQENANTLSEVTVRGQKPLITQEDDKTIVDPEPLAAISTNAYELMEKTPGLFLDQDGNIYLSSTTPATVYINGREQKMSTADIASILKSLPPNSIEKIEILRTPSAKYDASGSGGVVNVILKKGVKIGLTGSITAGMNQGRFGNQFAGFNLNNVNGSRTSYFNFNYSHRNSYDSLWSERAITQSLTLTQRAYTTTPAQSIYTGFGIGREINSKWSINTDTRFSYNPYSSLTQNISRQATTHIVGLSQNSVENNAKSISAEQSFATKYKIDTLGSELTTDLSYNYFSRSLDQSYSTAFTIPQIFSINGLGEIGNKRNSLAAQIDLKYKLAHKITLETGLKSTFQAFDSDTKYFTVKDNITTADIRRTNSYQYRENINAAYLQASRPLGSFLLKVGARIENTNMHGTQVEPQQSEFNVNRTDLFPYLYLSRKVMKIAGYELKSYLIARRSITRPVYEYLNPSIRIIDQYLYETGNPMLKPQFTQTYEANISVEERPIFAIGRNYTQNIFTNVVYQDPTEKTITVRTYDNLGKNQETYFRLMGALPPVNRYFFVVSAQYNYNVYEGLYESKPLNFVRGSWRFFTYQQLRIDKRSTINLHAFMNVNGQMQFYELQNFGMVSLSINRNFMNRKFNITANIADLFFTLPTQFALTQGSIIAHGRRQSDTRRVGINLRYNFGLRKKEDKNTIFQIDGDN